LADVPSRNQEVGPDFDAPQVVEIPVASVRVEGGLGRRRDRRGHLELQRSIERFGVLTPITVRPATDGSGDYYLVKGQGRTLACRVLGLTTIPAVILAPDVTSNEKVQQFLVENVARLRMSPVDRALLISRARATGEETAEVARRFGVSAQTVRRLEAQLRDASSGEVELLRSGRVPLSTHAIVSKCVSPRDREAVLHLIERYGTSSQDLRYLLDAVGWECLPDSDERILLLRWLLREWHSEAGSAREDRLLRLAARFPTTLPSLESED